MLFRRRRTPGPTLLTADLPERLAGRPRHRVRLVVLAERCLTRGQLLRQWTRHGAGVRHWWLQHSSGAFVGIALPRGDQPIDCVVELPAGRYTLGVGRAPDAIRIPVVVPDAEVAGPF